MYKKLAAATLSVMMLFMMARGVSACTPDCEPGDNNDECCEMEVRNRANITQRTEAYADTGSNYQDNFATGSWIMGSTVRAGGGDRGMQTGAATVLVDNLVRANINDISTPEPTKSSFMFGWGSSSPTVVTNYRNQATVDQRTYAVATTGGNAQDNRALLEHGVCSGVETGYGDRGMTTGTAYTGIGSIVRVNYNMN